MTECYAVEFGRAARRAVMEKLPVPVSGGLGAGSIGFATRSNDGEWCSS